MTNNVFRSTNRGREAKAPRGKILRHRAERRARRDARSL